MQPVLAKDATRRVEDRSAPQAVTVPGGDADHGEERRNEPGAEQAVVVGRFVQVGGDCHREDRTQVRRLLDGGLELGHGEVADADHPDVAVRPRAALHRPRAPER